MNDFSESQIPPGGWQWYQPQTKWTLDLNSRPLNSISITLDQAAELLQKHRLQNPQFNLPTDYQAIRVEIIQYNRQRLGLPPADYAPKYFPQQPNRAAVVADHVTKTAAGIRLVVDWLGSGLRPVSQNESEDRAAICVTCPQNKEGDLWQRLDAVAAEGLKRLIAIKTDMALFTSKDAQLKTCLACDCHLPLKVHAPIGHILKNTGDETMKRLDSRCWIKKAAST